MSKILFLTTSHFYNDDRIFYHQSNSLVKRGHHVKVCSLSSNFKGILGGIEVEAKNILSVAVNTKFRFFNKVCEDFQPDCIIASEPLAVLAGHKFLRRSNKSVIYDITEWYPSQRMLKPYSSLEKWFHWLRFSAIHIYAGAISTHFIFGEPNKMLPISKLFPFKPKILLPYYPDESYIVKCINTPESNTITLGYAGNFSEEKGIGSFLKLVHYLQRKRPEIEVKVKLIGVAKSPEDKKFFNDLLKKVQVNNFKLSPPVDFENFSAAGADIDVFFDLREINSENAKSLPIKIFYYAAAGKPVIYSDLRAIRENVEIDEFGFLVDPENTSSICSKVEAYIDNPRLYVQHAENARRMFEQKYSWKQIEQLFLDFVEDAIKG